MRPPHAHTAALCAACGDAAQDIRRCVRCKTVYCNATCQAADWPQHKHGCKNVRFVTTDMGNRVCMVTHAITAGTLLFVEDPDVVAPVDEELFSNSSKEYLFEYFPLAKRATTVHEALVEAGWTDADIIANYALAPESDELQSVAQRACTASTTPMVSLLTAQQYGTALYPRIRYVNHGCNPNAAYVTGIGGRGYLYSLRDMQENEEVLIGYTPLRRFMCTCLRQEIVRKRFGFVCACPRCLHTPCSGPYEESEWRKEGHSNFDPLGGFPVRNIDGIPTIVHEGYTGDDTNPEVLAAIHADEAIVETDYILLMCIAAMITGNATANLAEIADRAAPHAVAHYAGARVPEVLYLAAWAMRKDGSACDAHHVVSVAQSLRDRFAWHKTPLEFSPMPAFVPNATMKACFDSLPMYEGIEKAIRSGTELADVTAAAAGIGTESESGKDET